MLPDLKPMDMPDKADIECKYIELLSYVSGINASAMGPGLDKDFGARASMLISTVAFHI